MRYLLFLVFVVGCGSVSETPQDAPKTSDSSMNNGDAMIDAPTPACGTAGAACCASNVCNTGLSCTTGDQICRATTVFIGAASSNTGMAYVLRGNGTTFTTDTIGMGSIFSIYGTAANDVWVTAGYTDGNNAQKSYARHWNGTAWETAMPFASDGSVYALWGNAPNDYWAFTNGGGAYHWTGTSWGTLMPIDNGSVFTGSWGSSATNIWAFAQNREAKFGSGVWTTTTRSDFSAKRLTGVRATNTLVAGGSDPSGNNPEVLRDDGNTVVVDTLSTNNDCHEVVALWAGPNDVWAVSAGLFDLGACTSAIKLYHRTSTWAEATGVTGWNSLIGMAGSSNKDIFIAGRVSTGEPTVFHYDGTSWTGMYTATTVTVLGQMWVTGSPN
jgi:hypothetical protein